jgi:hypothetical protein
MINHMDELEKAFELLSGDESWQSDLNDTMRNECLNFATRLLSEVVRDGGDINQMTQAIRQAFRTLNSLQGK